MAKRPSEDKIRDYDETLRFCRVAFYALRKVGEHLGEDVRFMLRECPDFWRDKKLSFSESHRAVVTLCRDFLEMTEDYSGEVLVLWDQMLTSQRALTLTAMRTKHWKLVPKILKRGRIRNDDEYYLVRSTVDSSTLSDMEQTALVGLLERYGVRKK